MAMLAGRVSGTPDWQLDRLYEKESEQLWDAQNSIDEHIAEAVKHLKNAINGLSGVETSLVDVADSLDGLPIASRIMSVFYDLEHLECDLRKARKRRRKEWRLF